MVEPGDLKQLPHQTRETADADLTTRIAQLLGDSNDRTKPHAAHIRQIAQVEYQTGRTLCNT